VEPRRPVQAARETRFDNPGQWLVRVCGSSLTITADAVRVAA
jgi:hypothetical protein